MNASLPREATPMTVAQVLEALRKRKYFIHSQCLRDYVQLRLGMTAKAIIEELIEYLEANHRLYLLPGDPNKLQAVLRLDGGRYLVHLKINPNRAEQPWFLLLSFHDHNTGYKPLPM